MSRRFDAHSHLPNAEAPQVDAADPGRRRVVCGTGESDWEAVLAHAASDPCVIPMLGLHPWRLAEASPAWAPRLESLLRSHRAGLGECGLDFTRKDAGREAQESVFRTHLRWAHALHLPVAIHAVRAWGRLLDLLREEGVPAAGALVHAFAGSPETARALQSVGAFLSFSGDLLKADRPRLRESLLAVDADHLLLETDGTADLGQVLEVAAGIRGTTVAELERLTWENGCRCFKELMA